MLTIILRMLKKRKEETLTDWVSLGIFSLQKNPTDSVSRFSEALET